MNNRPTKGKTAADSTMSVLSFLADSAPSVVTGAAAYVAYGVKEGVRAVAHNVTDPTGVLDVVNSMVKDGTMKVVDAIGLGLNARETMKFYTNLYQTWEYLTPAQRGTMITFSILAQAAPGYAIYNMANHEGEDNEKHMVAVAASLATSSEALTAGRYLTTMFANNNIKKGMQGTAEERVSFLPQTVDEEVEAVEVLRPRFSNMG